VPEPEYPDLDPNERWQVMDKAMKELELQIRLRRWESAVNTCRFIRGISHTAEHACNQARALER
jgi:hypothetical protein